MKNSSREKLAEMEKENRYVFHGSGSVIEAFEPRQAYQHIDGKNIPDGEPAIFASPFAEYAIFMALVNAENCPKNPHSGVSCSDGLLSFCATKETLEQLGDSAKGHVYAFNRRDFAQRNQSEWLSLKSIRPVLAIEVARSDFIPEIEIIP